MSTRGPGVTPPAGPRLRWVVGAAVVVAVLADLLVWPVVAPFGVLPDTVLAVALALTVTGDRRPGLWVAVGGGLLCDLAGGVLIGLGSAARALAVLLADWLVARAPSDRFGVTVAIAALSAATCEAAQRAGAVAFGVETPFSWVVAARAVGFVLLTGALFAVAYTAVSWARLADSVEGLGRRWQA
ncbi:MAG TPA: hypothetical protein VIK73_02220 [Limnochordales bacterium]